MAAIRHIYHMLFCTALIFGLSVVFLGNSPANAKTINVPNSSYDYAKGAHGNSKSKSGNDYKATPSNNILNVKKHPYNGTYAYAYGSRGASNKTVASNRLNIKSGAKVGHAYGGSSDRNKTVKKNKLVLSGGSIFFHAYGGITGGKGVVTGNSVVIQKGSAGMLVKGGRSDGNGAVTGNSVTIKAGSAGRVYGGETIGTGGVSGNKVTLSGGKVMEIYGGLTHNSAGKVTGNKVTVSGGTVSKNIYCGFNASFKNDGVFKNTVTIKGGTVKGDIFAGYNTGYSTSGSAINNTVVLSGSPKLATSTIWGGANSGLTSSTSWSDLFTGNTVKFSSFKGSVKGLKNFARYDFVLGKTLKSGNTVVNIKGNDYVNLGKTNVAITGVANGSTLKKGNSVTLINMVFGTPATIKSTNVKMGSTKLYDFDVTVKENKLTASVKDVRANAKTKSLALGVQSGLVSLNQATDRLSASLPNAVAASRGMPGLVPFGDASGWGAQGFGPTTALTDHTRAGASSGNPFSKSAIVGLATSSNTSLGDLTFGSFVETGGSGLHNPAGYSHLSDVSSRSESTWKGAGMFSRFDAANGLYVEGTMRSGRLEVYNSNHHNLGTDGHTGQTYMAGHIGLGRVWQLSDELSLDAWTRSAMSRLQGGNMSLADDKLGFGESSSLRGQAGTRLTWKPNDRVTPYAGLSYEHEFDGKVRSSLRNGVSVNTASLAGDTGIAEFGLTLSPSKDKPLYLDLNGQGSMGKRSGVVGGLQLRYEF